VLALFGLNIFWTGIEKMLNPSEKNKLLLMIAATLTFIALFFASDWLLTLILDKLYFAFFA
jgi:divalent metal cation (Fe/Co/Zn/Cd) transporter